MCGRFVQYQGVYDYLEILAPERVQVFQFDLFEHRENF